MKRFIYFAAAACVALAGCTKNEALVVEGNSNQLITFESPVLGIATKVDYNTVEYPPTGIFHVVGKIHEGDYKKSNGTNYGWSGYDTYMDTPVQLLTVYVNGTSVKSWFPSNGSGTEEVYYWPKNSTPAKKLTFIAYSPNDVTPAPTIDDAGIHFANYVVGSAADKDLLYSHRTYNKTSSTTGTPGSADPESSGYLEVIDGDHYTYPGAPHYDGVNILFEHALSAVTFTVRTNLDYGTTKVKITGITLDKVYDKANFNQGILDVDVATEGVKVQHADNNWTSHSIEGTGTYEPFTGSQDVDDSAKPVGNTMYLLPQDFTSRDDMKVTVNYQMINTAVDPNVTVDCTYTTELNNFTVKEWLRGKKYIYNIVIGLDKIYFAPQVVDWTEVSVSSIDI